jgi:hypothetical protein
MHTYLKVSAFGLVAMAMVSDGPDARNLRIGPEGASDVCAAAAARAPSLIVRGITVAEICNPFGARTGDVGAPVGMLFGLWSAGLVALARFGW